MIIYFGELLQAGLVGEHQIIREQDSERVIAYESARTPDRVPKTKRHLLTHRHDGPGLHRHLAQHGQLGFLVAFLEGLLQLVGDIEMLDERGLAAARYHAELLDPGRARFLDRILDQRLVHDGKHFLGRRLGSGQKPGAKAGDGQHGLLQGLDH